MPRRSTAFRDLARPEVRFINAQSGSGTRFLLDLLLRKHGVDPAQVRGYEQCEMTHAAVAAYVASGMADVGLGVETPARQFKLGFVPIETERYFLSCETRSFDLPAVSELLSIVRGQNFKSMVNELPGDQADESTGSVTDLRLALPTLKAPKTRRPAA